jgi:signal transduction histidine kinase
MVAAVTLALYPITKLDPGVSSGVLYVLGVLLVATYQGLWSGLLTSLASALALYYFHTDPMGSLDGKDAADLMAIGMLLTTSVVASVIADRARRRADALRAGEAERIRLRELRASRARVLRVADEERRRVVRDLHDGAQQRLVHTVVVLELARSQLADADPAATRLVDEALEQARLATDELRELAHGILPAALTRGGLRTALAALASRAALPVELDVGPGRHSSAVEAAAYFVVAEGLTNVTKHARASRARVTAVARGDLLVVGIEDDGAGGVDANGPGLLGMQDRLGSLDGRLGVDSPLGGGTRLVAWIPLAPRVADVREDRHDAPVLGGRGAEA